MSRLLFLLASSTRSLGSLPDQAPVLLEVQEFLLNLKSTGTAFAIFNTEDAACCVAWLSCWDMFCFRCRNEHHPDESIQNESLGSLR